MWPKVHLHSKLAKRSKKIDSITKKLFFRTLIVILWGEDYVSLSQIN